MTPVRPRLSPAIADVRRAVRGGLHGGLQNALHNALHNALQNASPNGSPLVLVGLSGGADSLALAAATAFEAPRAGLRAGAVIIDHGLQTGSADVAAGAETQARALGLDPVLVRRVQVVSSAGGGPEAAARAVRYSAFAAAMTETGAVHVLLGHTLDDQAETVLLGLARGAGPVSLQGMAAQAGPYLRPLLGIRRATTEQFCRDSSLEPWNDPHNVDTAFARVRVRQTVLPSLERELGPGIAQALARTAAQLRDDASALDDLALDRARAVTKYREHGATVDIPGLAVDPPAVVHRVIRIVAEHAFGVSLSYTQTRATAALIADWHGQKEVNLPGVRVVRNAGRLIFRPLAAPADHDSSSSSSDSSSNSDSSSKNE